MNEVENQMHIQRINQEEKCFIKETWSNLKVG
jgi:hypothetical protein